VSPKSYKKHPKNKINIKVCTICIYNYVGIIHYSKRVILGWWKSSATFYIIFGPQMFFLKRTHIGVNLYGESIARIPKAWKLFPDLIQGKQCIYWSENVKIWIFAGKL